MDICTDLPSTVVCYTHGGGANDNDNRWLVSHI